MIAPLTGFFCLRSSRYIHACRAENPHIVARMDTGSFSYQLLKKLPETLFALMRQSLARVVPRPPPLLYPSVDR